MQIRASSHQPLPGANRGPNLHNVTRRVVNQSYMWKQRTVMLEKAMKFNAAGYLSASDVHLLNWLLVGCRECFRSEKGGRWASDTYTAVWEALSQPYTWILMTHHPIQEYCCRIFDACGGNAVCSNARAAGGSHCAPQLQYRG